MQAQNQSQISNLEKLDDHTASQDQYQFQVQTAIHQIPLQLTSQQLSIQGQQLQEEPSLIEDEEESSDELDQYADQQNRNLLTENLVKISDFGNQYYEQVNMKFLHYLLIELLSRPYPTKKQVSEIQSYIERYFALTNSELRNKCLSRLKCYYIERSYNYPLSEWKLQAQWKDYIPNEMKNNFIIAVLKCFLAQELNDHQIQNIEAVILEYFNKPQQYGQLAKIQQICLCSELTLDSDLPQNKKSRNSKTMIIAKIQQLFEVFNNSLGIVQQDEIINNVKLQFKADQPIILKKNYTDNQYLRTLLKLIKKAIIDESFFINLQQFAHKYPSVLSTNFQTYLQSESLAQKTLLESFYIWIFEKKRFSDDLGKCIQKIISSPSNFIKLMEQDIQQLEQIIHSQGAWAAIEKINSTAKLPQNQLQEYKELLSFLRNFQVISLDIDGIAGITLYNGIIGLNRSKIYPYGSDKRKRALTIVTLLHETFGHKKRIEYVNQDNVLNLTTPKFSEADVDGNLGEAGNFVEKMTFGKKLNEVTDEQADFILNANNWKAERSSESIISEFKSLPSIPETQITQGTDRQTLKQSNRQDENIVPCCIFALLNKSRQKKQ